MINFSPLVGFELRTSRFAVKLKSTFFEAFASPPLAFWRNWLTEIHTVIPHLLEELSAGAKYL